MSAEKVKKTGNIALPVLQSLGALCEYLKVSETFRLSRISDSC